MIQKVTNIVACTGLQTKSGEDKLKIRATSLMSVLNNGRLTSKISCFNYHNNADYPKVLHKCCLLSLDLLLSYEFSFNLANAPNIPPISKECSHDKFVNTDYHVVQVISRG